MWTAVECLAAGHVLKALSFEINDRDTYGLFADEQIWEADDDFRWRYVDLRAVLAADALAELPKHCSAAALATDSIRFLPPIPNPDKLICVGVNYRPHVEEMGREIPEHPLLFVRFPASQVGHRQALVKPSISEQYDFEGELAIVIGEKARHVSRDNALDYIAGYTCFMDGTVRDWQRHTTQFTPGKNFKQSGAMGPYLVTPDELSSPSELALETRINGEIMQRGTAADLIFDIPALIAYCSTFTELLPGDVIATGTPGGVGAARKPPVWLRAGDVLEVDIGELGCLCNTVRGE